MFIGMPMWVIGMFIGMVIGAGMGGGRPRGTFMGIDPMGMDPMGMPTGAGAGAGAGADASAGGAPIPSCRIIKCESDCTSTTGPPTGTWAGACRCCSIRGSVCGIQLSGSTPASESAARASMLIDGIGT